MSEQKILISIEGRGEEVVDNISQAFKYMQTNVKEADYDFSQRTYHSKRHQKSHSL